MSFVRTGKLLSKLEQVIDFTLERGASKSYPIIVGESTPATDGTQIFLPARESIFKSERDNEISLANSTAHEADHIKEINEYFGEEAQGLRQEEENLVKVYLDRNYSELKENPALAGFIDNIVKDRRIDDIRRKTFPRIEKHYSEAIIPGAQYFRPSTLIMSELDAFNELYLQRALLGKTFESVPEKRKVILDEIVSITYSANSIQTDKEAVTRIYDIYKANFDINQPISKLPPILGSNRHSSSSKEDSKGKVKDGSGNRSEEKDGKDGKSRDDKENKDPTKKESGNYSREIKPREDRDANDKKPEKLNDDSEKNNYQNPNKNQDKNSGPQKDNKTQNLPPQANRYSSKSNNKIDKDFYDNQSRENSIDILNLCDPSNEENEDRADSLFRGYAGEIESMKRIFRQLKLRNYGEKRYFEGQELDFEEHLQADLESRATGIRVNRKSFIEKARNKLKPIFAIHADKSGSTQGKIIEAIRDAFYIMGNALSASEYNYGMYVSNDALEVIKSPREKWSEKVNNRISGINSDGNGIFLESTSRVIANDLKRINGNPKCLFVISDFEICGEPEKEKAIIKELYNSRVYPILIAIGSEHEQNAKYLTGDIGHEYYSVIPIDKLNTLPQEVFRLFKTYGIAR